MHWQTTHHLNQAIDVSWRGAPLFRYTYAPDTPANETPKPYMHPLRTLAGDPVTNYRPTDHPWHHGLAMTFAELSGQNFWGGPTYVRDVGYQWRDDHGRQQHEGWRAIEQDETGVRLAHDVAWISHEGQRWLEEQRHIEAAAPRADEGWWVVRWHMTLRNVSTGTLELGSPTTNGRPAAGYGSLFWRGPRDFTGGTVLNGEGEISDDEMMGRSAPWLAFSGKHDGSLAASTLVFVDHPDNPRYPNKWFVRSKPFATASFSFMFDEIYELPPQETITLRYAVVIANGALEPARINPIAEAAFTG